MYEPELSRIDEIILYSCNSNGFAKRQTIL